jgi:serine/threonine protein phosphatase PrpC
VTALAVRVSLRSSIGARSRNEDCVGVEQDRGHWCLVLSDGAGGHCDGALASRLVVDRVLMGFRSRPPTDAGDLSELLLDAHDAVVAAQRARGMTDPATAMHATVVVLVIDTTTGRALWGHVGDSRLYVWRDGRIAAMTRDDSVVQWMLDAGAIDPARVPDVANRGLLLAALGSEEDIEPHVVSEPFELRDSDAFLLCSDGWWGGLDEAHIEALLADASTPEQWLDSMAAATLGRADPRQDNYSAIGCWIGDRIAAGQSDDGTVFVPHLYDRRADDR